MAQLLEQRDQAAIPLTEPGDLSAARSLYATVSDPEASFAFQPEVDAIRSELRSAAADEADLPAFEELAATWSAEERERYGALVDAHAPEDLLVGRAALGCAPLALVSGSWLQWLSAPGNAHEETVLAILTLYASDVGVGHPRASRGSAYLELLRQVRVADYASPAAHLVHDYRVPDFAFYVPSLMLAMSRRPDEFLPELLGADLGLRMVGMLPPLAIVQAGEGVHADWAALDPGAERPGEEAPGGVPQARAAIASLLRDGLPEAEERLLRGFRWAYETLVDWSESLRSELAAVLDPAHEMAALLKLRAREGSVYHQKFKLEGRPLASWLAESRTDPRPLMHTLASSKLVKPGRSESSALVTGLVSERGPMFRVFAPEDLAVIRRWIDALPGADERDEPPASPSDDRLRVPNVPFSPGERNGAARLPQSVREAYHRLQPRPGSPALRSWAESYVRGWLARARLGLGTDEGQLPERWSPEGLRPWLLDQHDRHAEGFEADQQTPLPSREALIDSTVQLAPLTLIDGSWLQGFTDYEHASSELGRFLFETYWDELGNGLPHLNHPRIYRELLDQMEIELPPTRSREFAESPLLRDRSFELPVYWLSIGHFPQTFMPEVLGLNVAMELSGVGGSYRRARIALKHHGFSTRFVDIHNTIDNVATGHSAWAADAVDTYIASVGNTQGREAQEAAWERVRTGFVSLDPPDGLRARRTQRRAQREALAGGNRR
jgi:hypothetical protein